MASSPNVGGCGRMRVLGSAFVLLAALVLGLSFAVPVEDAPDTSYDESEALPYEGTPRFSVMQQQESVFAPRLDFPLQFHREPKGEMPIERSQRKAHPIFDSVTILHHSLRC